MDRNTKIILYWNNLRRIISYWRTHIEINMFSRGDTFESLLWYFSLKNLIKPHFSLGETFGMLKRSNLWFPFLRASCCFKSKQTLPFCSEMLRFCSIVLLFVRQNNINCQFCDLVLLKTHLHLCVLHGYPALDKSMNCHWLPWFLLWNSRAPSAPLTLKIPSLKQQTDTHTGKNTIYNQTHKTIMDPTSVTSDSQVSLHIQNVSRWKIQREMIILDE